MCYRANIGQASRLLGNILTNISSGFVYEKTLKLIESESQLINTHICEEVFPYAKWALILAFIGRAILLTISLKRLSICKVYVYYEMLALITSIGLPIGDSLGASLSKFTND